MKSNIKKLFVSLMLTSMATLFLTSCVEHRYYTRNHHHSRHYYESRRMTPPPGVDIEIHN